MATHLVFGAEGFLGGYLVAELRATQPSDRVVAVTRRHCDMRSEKDVGRLLAENAPDRIYHFVGASRVSDTVPMPPYFESNFLTTAALGRVLRRRKEPTAVFLASSVHVYGNQAGTVDEDAPPRPSSHYAHTKFLAEEALRRLCLDSGSHRAVIGRFYSCLGPGQPEGFVAADLCRRIAGLPPNAASVLKTGPLGAYRRFLDVRDAVALVHRLLAVPAAAGACDVVNIASPHEVTIREIVDRLLALSGRPARVESTEAGANSFQGLKVDLAKLERLVPGFTFRPLETTLRDMWTAAG